MKRWLAYCGKVSCSYPKLSWALISMDRWGAFPLLPNTRRGPSLSQYCLPKHCLIFLRLFSDDCSDRQILLRWVRNAPQRRCSEPQVVGAMHLGVAKEEDILCSFCLLFFSGLTVSFSHCSGPGGERVKPYLVANAFSSLWGLITDTAMNPAFLQVRTLRFQEAKGRAESRQATLGPKPRRKE